MHDYFQFNRFALCLLSAPCLEDFHFSPACMNDKKNRPASCRECNCNFEHWRETRWVLARSKLRVQQGLSKCSIQSVHTSLSHNGWYQWCLTLSATHHIVKLKVNRLFKRISREKSCTVSIVLTNVCPYNSNVSVYVLNIIKVYILTYLFKWFP